MKNKNKITTVLILLFIVIAILVTLNLTTNLDTNFYKYINSFQNQKLTNFFKIITLFGGIEIVAPLVMLLLIFIKDKISRLIIIITMSTTTIMNPIIKNIFAIERPNINPLIKETNYSFPSGHTMAATAIYGICIYLIYQSKLPKYLKNILIIFLIALIILISLSRIYLGVHNFTDIISGIILSIIVLNITTELIKKYKNIRS